MEEYKVKQIKPNHADHISNYNEKFINKLLESETVIAQPKYDGERMLIHIDNGDVYCTSRRLSTKTNRYTENQDKLPILKEVFKNFSLGYTVIDCECYAKDWSTIVGILHSLPDRAIELQNENAAKFACFDCLFYNDKDVRDFSYCDRLELLKDVLSRIRYENIHLVQGIGTNYMPCELEDAMWIGSESAWKTAMQNALSVGFEGIVVKSLNKKYYDKAASLKCKKFETLDVVVCGYQDGNGKYTNSVGALYVGYYDQNTDSIVRISKVNCGSDAEREMWNKNRSAMLNTVIEVKCQEVTERSLRHPVYLRIREDKDYKMCTKDTIFKE